MDHLVSENITIHIFHIGDIIAWLFKYCKYLPSLGADTKCGFVFQDNSVIALQSICIYTRFFETVVNFSALSSGPCNERFYSVYLDPPPPPNFFLQSDGINRSKNM